MPYKINIGDKIQTKKNHPCGANEFTVVRTGMDFIIECENCKKDIWINRQKLEKRIKKIYRNDIELDKSEW